MSICMNSFYINMFINIIFLLIFEYLIQCMLIIFPPLSFPNMYSYTDRYVQLSPLLREASKGSSWRPEKFTAEKNQLWAAHP